MSKKSFNPIGVPMLLAAGSGSSMEGTIRPGEDGGFQEEYNQSVGLFYVEEYGDKYEVFFNNNGTDTDNDDGYYILYQGAYVDIGWDGDWVN